MSADLPQGEQRWTISRGWVRLSHAPRELVQIVDGPDAVGVEVVPSSVAAERDRLREALASMPMPEAGPGMAWPTEYCPFCEWEGKPDRLIPPAKQDHDADCPVRRARAALASTSPGLEGDGEK